MGYLRLVRLPPPEPAAEDDCVRLFDSELDYIFETLRRLGAPAAELEDLAHDVFVVLHRNWQELDAARPLRPYLFGVAFRIVCAQRRRRSREVPFSAPDMEDEQPNPEGVLQSQESVALLVAALACIPIKRRAVVIMHDLDEVPVTDIAEALSITRFGAYARLHKGRTELAAAVRRLQRQVRRT